MSIKKPAGLSGSSGLVAAIIAQATTDALRGKPASRADALEYFRGRGGDYKRHLRMIDKPSDWLPQDQD